MLVFLTSNVCRFSPLNMYTFLVFKYIIPIYYKYFPTYDVYSCKISLCNNIWWNETEKLNRTDQIVQMIFSVNNELHNLECAQITILSRNRKNQNFLNIYHGNSKEISRLYLWNASNAKKTFDEKLPTKIFFFEIPGKC